MQYLSFVIKKIRLLHLGQYALFPPQIVLKLLNLLGEILNELDRDTCELLLVRHSASIIYQGWTRIESI